MGEEGRKWYFSFPMDEPMKAENEKTNEMDDIFGSLSTTTEEEETEATEVTEAAEASDSMDGGETDGCDGECDGGCDGGM